ncbi:MAG: hypothetical protein QM809_18340 [Gordonia sp. (in: high G+C Gram-positive bacteria)]|uniref:hypothetical protein n=1 Tax=Gordonia sp. (in: high G+C Gram-positive bacteria) TaxID=84139 RepID=UPI0039E6CB5F
MVNDKCAAIMARRDRDESIRQIAAGVGVSVATVHKLLADESGRTATEAAQPHPTSRPAESSSKL